MKYIKCSLAALLACSTLTAAGPASGPAPMFGLNDANRGQSIYTGPTTQPNIAWTYDIGSFTYAPRNLALSDEGILYTPGLYALHADDGSLAWHSPTGGRSSSPALDNLGRVYAFEGGRLIARNAQTGTLAWMGVPTSASDGDPVKIAPNGNIYSSTFNGDIYVYSPAGSLLWTAHTGSAQYGEISHIVALDAASNAYYSGSNLRSVDAAGNVRWTTSFNAGTSSVVMLAPNGDVVWQRDNLVEDRDSNTGVLKSSFSSLNTLQAMDSAGNLYFTSNIGIYKTTPDGQLIWEFLHNYMDWPIAIDANGNVYAGDQQGNIFGISATGSEMWEIHISNQYPFLYNTAPVIGPEGQLYVLQLQGSKLTALVSIPEPSSVVLTVLGGCLLATAYVRRRFLSITADRANDSVP